MPLSKKKLTTLLVDSGVLTAPELDTASKKAKDEEVPIEQVLEESGLIPADQVGRLFADAYGVSYADIESKKIDPNIFRSIPEIVAKKHQVIVYDHTDAGAPKVAMVDPSDFELVSLLGKRFGAQVKIAYVTPGAFAAALSAYSSDVRKEVLEIADRLEQVSRTSSEGREGLVVRLVQLLIEYGYDNTASDIHIEPHEGKTVVRYRIDGILHDVFELPGRVHGLVVSRIKILSNLRTDEHFAAQDGKFRADVDGDKVDIRVSSVPIIGGEKIVLRLLSEKGRVFTLENVGLMGEDRERVRRAARKPYGMILATGPTGSGKTTTLYAVLRLLNKRNVNIATIEDPVEYDIEGVNQIQVNIRTELTFAKGLRSIVRQDPDIIMVGEIRDDETAGISVNAAMTGHLVLSTLHTNDAATSLPRLLDMKVEPFLIASSVNVIIAQRLVRKICRACIASIAIDLAEYKESIPPELFQAYFGKKTKVRAFYGKGCDSCGGTGYEGRIGIFEVLEVTNHVRSLITERANAAEITEAAKGEGMTTMLEDGIRKVLQGVTTIEEVMRVVR